MTPKIQPVFGELPRDEALALLRRNHLGRIAFTLHDRVDIEPLSYVAVEEWIFARTSPGRKVSTVRHHPWVAFQVDEIRGPFDWDSVVVHGALAVLTGSGAKVELEAFAMAVGALRMLDPTAFTDDDVTPQRTQILRIHVDQIAGRNASALTG